MEHSILKDVITSIKENLLPYHICDMCYLIRDNICQATHIKCNCYMQQQIHKWYATRGMK